MSEVAIDFYHDVLCVWCFLASARLRRVVQDDLQIEVNHHAFALAPEADSLSRMFGSPEAGKEEILGHWAAAAAHPDGETIQVELMRSRDFPYPTSMPGLLACKAAQFQGGMPAHWKMFDRVQRAHAVEARNIADPAVLKACAADIEMDLPRWEADFQSEAARQAVEADLEEASQIGISAVPTMVFNHQWVLSGAVPEATLRKVIDNLRAGRDPSSAG